jgi:CTP:molybdopterin cytidylyltransferase MocA
MESRIATVKPVVILAAGRATRLGGVNKLLVTAGGLPVHEWHRRAFAGADISIVVHDHSIRAIKDEIPWSNAIIGTDKFNGPVGALDAYLAQTNHRDGVTVVFADTLIPPQPLSAGDWVGVAAAPARRWDMPSARGHWVRGIPRIPVCVGIYSFADMDALREAASAAHSDAAKMGEKETPMTMLLNRYGSDMPWLRVRGWHDAGDPAAVASVPLWESVVAARDEIASVEGTLDARWTR